MKKLILTLGFVCTAIFLFAQQSGTWIWYPGDFEVWLSNDMQNRRTERGTFFPPFWKMDSHYVLVEFHKEFDLQQEEEIAIYAEGKYNVKLNGKMLPGMPTKLKLGKGKQKINVKVYNQAQVPALYVSGKTVFTDKDWLATYEDKEWIDETGKASDQSGTTYVKAGYWNFNNAAQSPSKFRLPTRTEKAVASSKQGKGTLIDFGKNTFGFLTLHQLKGSGELSIYYGESKEEALAIETCETLDIIALEKQVGKDSTLALSKAFRYVYVEPKGTAAFNGASMEYEFLPVEDRGSFKSSDEELNKIWDVAKYTMELTSREFYIDGIKRDRWIWSGDAYQSYAMNYYLGFDSETVKRTILALRGKEPTVSHINTIMDYTFYWFLSIYDYYQYTGDKEFIASIYPRMQSLMQFCLDRRNTDGLMQGLSGDWVFIDWADGLSKQGEVSFEQLLLCRSLETMALCADLVGQKQDQQRYTKEATQLKAKIFDYYWNEQKGAFAHSRIDGKQTDNVTRYTNMFAIFFDYLSATQQQAVKDKVLLNEDIQKIMTPYMRYYELEALCALGEKDYVMKEMKNYWGGMLKLGATTFWEEYNPDKKGAEHYAMYGREFGKSLCHSWGASPIYLLGKYYLGVTPTAAGYEEYTIEPYLASLEWMEGKVPTPQGEIAIHVSKKKIKVQSPIGTGTLHIKSKVLPRCKQGTVKKLENDTYSVELKKGISYEVDYEA
ncbi:trehalase family glycosidase [Sphingobacterium oryzagri]|uniref:Trehalase family glycosidase n=1 Tax=Sphingobacterium oryzagri TaxID=3025669 RepID=A0ABY7WHL4_9SPHI|nr:trehalase family glycosidase [Sphingobacterium sp. KACC 22765]WDF69108.1 trehalase family glycosidase [Sphingobacterium sp. KACC 22765]